jgi:hypothetical protein
MTARGGYQYEERSDKASSTKTVIARSEATRRSEFIDQILERTERIFQCMDTPHKKSKSSPKAKDGRTTPQTATIIAVISDSQSGFSTVPGY